jgi:hypothetical protein
VLAGFITFNFVCLAWIFFRARTWDDAMAVLDRLSELSLSANNLGWVVLATLAGAAATHLCPACVAGERLMCAKVAEAHKSAKKTKGKPHPYCVGFAAESTKLEEHADEKRKRKGIPLIVGNIGPDTFGSDLNQLLLIHERGSKKLAKAPKLQLARQLIQFVATQL